LYGYCLNDPMNFVDPAGLTKGRKQKISGNQELVDGIGKKSSAQEIQETIEKVTKALKNDHTLSKKCSITNLPIVEFVKEIMPLILALLVALAIVTYVPSLIMFLPNLL